MVNVLLQMDYIKLVQKYLNWKATEFDFSS